MKPGEVHAIMGPNGSGKSTLSSVLVGNPAFEVTRGSITFYGKNLLELSPEDRSHEAVSYTHLEVKRAIEDLRSKLLASRQRLNRPLIDLNYKIDAEYFKLSLVSGEKEPVSYTHLLLCQRITPVFLSAG